MPETIARYRDFIDYGADGVIGTHPHCPQGWEKYKGRPIFYSLGNFLFNSKGRYEVSALEPHWYEGLCVLVTIVEGKLTWEVFNTRNVANVSIEIDHDLLREKNNNQLCQYLNDEEIYNAYLQIVLKQQANTDLEIIKRMFLPQSNIEALKVLWACLRGNKPASKDALRFIMKNDLRRMRFIREIR